jgi:hypothetical protein
VTADEVRAVLARCACPGDIAVTRMVLREPDWACAPGPYVLILEAEVTDAYAKVGRMPLRSVHTCAPAWFRGPRDVLGFLRRCLESLYLHELREQFEYEGRKVWDPHK